MKRSLLFLLIVLFACRVPGLAMAKGTRMKVGWCETADPFKHMVSAGMYVFKKCAEEYSGGSIKVELYPAGQLGDAKSLLEQTKEGIIQGCMSIPSGLIAGRYYPDFYIFDVPYLFSNSTIAWRVLNTSTNFFEKINAGLIRNTGLRLLDLGIEGQRHFTNNIRPIRKPSDLKGLKIRTMEVPAHMKLVKALGGSPIPVSWLELYTALQTGVVDGEENPLSNIEYMKFYEVQKYMTLDGHITLLDAFVVNNKWFESRPEGDRKILLQAAETAAVAHRGMNEILEGKAMESLQKRMDVTFLTTAEKSAFKGACQQPVIDYIRSQIRDQGLLDELLVKVKEAEAN